MMKYILFISLPLLIINEVTYKCMDDNLLETKTACSYTINQTIHIRACEGSNKCNIPDVKTGLKNGTVTYCKQLNSTRYYGDVCDDYNKCASGYCKEGKCVERQVGENCTAITECGKNAYCMTQCKEYKKEKEECDGITTWCGYGLICGRTEPGQTKTCIKRYSIPNGNYSSAAELCKSGLVDNENICYDTQLKPEHSTFEECKDVSTCSVLKVVGDKQEEIELSCRTSMTLKNYCPVTSTSKEWESYVQAFNTFYNKAGSTNYHPAVLEMMDVHLIKELRTEYYKTQVDYIGLPDCVMETIYQYMKSSTLKVSFMLIGIVVALIGF